MYPLQKEGFFVEVSSKNYSGPFTTLNEARDFARSKSPALKIFHGILILLSPTEIDDRQLFLVPKLKKGDKV
jgi:hypothetical protein